MATVARLGLRTNVSLAEAVSEMVDLAIVVLDPVGYVVAWNEGAKQIFGYAECEIVGRKVSILCPEEEPLLSPCERALKAAELHGRFEEEGWRLRKDGTRFWGSSMITAVRDERRGLQGYALVTRDLSERRRAEENERRLVGERTRRAAAEEAEVRLKFLAAAGAALAESLDFESTLRRVAEVVVPQLADWCTVAILEEGGAFRRIAAVHRDPLKASLIREYETRFPPSEHRAGRHAAVLREGRPVLVPEVHDAELAASAQDPEHLALMRGLEVGACLMVPLVSRGQTLGVLSLIRAKPWTYDAVDLALAQELASRAALAVDNARLYEAERAARARAQQQAQQLQEAVEVRDTFLSVASHELRTPLTPMALRLQALERLTEHQSDSPYVRHVRKYAETASRQIDKLSNLIGDLLDVSRIAAGKLKLELESTDVAALVREVVSRFEFQASKLGSPIDVTAPQSLWTATAKLRLDQVITNLVDNALKYGAGKPIQLQLQAEEEQLVLKVRDRGIGIAPENLSRIFERFERAVSDRNYGGLGLGLYITRTIVEALGGTVLVESKPGSGTAFEVRLPLEVRRSRSTAPTGEPPRASVAS